MLTAVQSGFHPEDTGTTVTVPSCQASCSPCAYQQPFISVTNSVKSYYFLNIISIMEGKNALCPKASTEMIHLFHFHTLTFQFLARTEIRLLKSSNTQTMERKIRKKARD